MRRVGLTSTAALAIVALCSASAFGQSESGSRRTGGGGERTGTAVPRGGGDSGRHGGSSSGSSGGSTSASAPAPSAPSSGGLAGGGGDRAVSRSAPERRHGPAAAEPSTRSRGRSSGVSSSEPNAVAPVRESPEYARPRGDRPAISRAIPRSEAPFPPSGGYYPIYPRYPGAGFYYPGYWGFGAFYYDPWWWGGYGAYPYGYGHGGYGYGGYGYGGYGHGGSGSSYDDYGKLRLKVKPREAQVYVDGYFSGVVDNFDGVFQRLSLRAGGHRIEIRSDGFQTLSFEVMIAPGETVTYTGELRPLP